MANVNQSWIELISSLRNNGTLIAPRGKMTYELLGWNTRIDMCAPVITLKERKLNYQFMAKEASWILNGDNKLDPLAKYIPAMANYSDDGLTLYGAYGPPIIDQLPYVINALKKDELTRRAGLTIWRQNPSETKDTPCTIALWFVVRQARLNCFAFMRSSDAWLGLPYDIFNFSMVSYAICGILNLTREDKPIAPGTLYHNAASVHLYVNDIKRARSMLINNQGITRLSPNLPNGLWNNGTVTLMRWLTTVSLSRPGDPERYWEVNSCTEENHAY